MVMNLSFWILISNQLLQSEEYPALQTLKGSIKKNPLPPTLIFVAWDLLLLTNKVCCLGVALNLMDFSIQCGFIISQKELWLLLGQVVMKTLHSDMVDNWWAAIGALLQTNVDLPQVRCQGQTSCGLLPASDGAQLISDCTSIPEGAELLSQVTLAQGLPNSLAQVYKACIAVPQPSFLPFVLHGGQACLRVWRLLLPSQPSSQWCAGAGF